MDPVDYRSLTGAEIRALCRDGKFDGPTAGVAAGFAQANLIILPATDAQSFAEFCRLNPAPCPVLEVTEPGDFEPRVLAPGADLRTDLPRYRVYRDGVCVDAPTSITPHWTDNLVSFLLGCSFGFESALMASGVPVRHVEEGRNVPMYRTSIACRPAGLFEGPLVVSMRPMTEEQADQAVRVTAPLPQMHGAPVRIGAAEELGIADLDHPDYGDAVTIRPGEVPVFWACGVTPIEALIRAKLHFAITHEPGHMFVTDIRAGA